MSTGKTDTSETAQTVSSPDPATAAAEAGGTPTQKERDVFAEAFAQISAADAAPPAKEADGGTGEKTKTEETAPAEGTQSEVKETSVQPETKPEIKPATLETPKPAGEEILERLVGALEKRGGEKEQPASQEIVQDKPAYSQDELMFLDQYVKDFPDVSRAEALIRRAEYVEITKYIFNEFVRVAGPEFAILHEIAARTHLGDIQSRVPDYETTREAVIEWVDKQPDYLKEAYQRVVQQGTPAQVADIISRYKQEAGASTAAAAATSTSTSTSTSTAPQTGSTGAVATETKLADGLDDKTKRAAAALAPVTSKRTTVVVEDNKNNFDAAFDTYVKEPI